MAGHGGDPGSGPASGLSRSLDLAHGPCVLPSKAYFCCPKFTTRPLLVYVLMSCWLVLSARVWRARGHVPPSTGESCPEQLFLTCLRKPECPGGRRPFSARLPDGSGGDRAVPGVGLLLMPTVVSCLPAAVHRDLALHHPALPPAHHGLVLPGVHPGEPRGSRPGRALATAPGRAGPWASPTVLGVMSVCSACRLSPKSMEGVALLCSRDTVWWALPSGDKRLGAGLRGMAPRWPTPRGGAGGVFPWAQPLPLAAPCLLVPGP